MLRKGHSHVFRELEDIDNAVPLALNNGPVILIVMQAIAFFM